MQTPILKSNKDSMTFGNLSSKASTWKKIIVQSLEYFTLKYPKYNETTIDYTKVDVEYMKINLIEANILKNLYAEYFEKYKEDPFSYNSVQDGSRKNETIIQYLDYNKKFMSKFLFAQSDEDVVITEFNELQNILINCPNIEISNLAKERKVKIDDLAKIDFMLTTALMVKRYRRMFLLRKNEIISTYFNLIFEKDSLKNLKVSDNNFTILANIINNEYDFAAFKIEIIQEESSNTKPMLKAAPTKEELDKIKNEINECNTKIKESLNGYFSVEDETVKTGHITTLQDNKQRRELLTDYYNSLKTLFEKEQDVEFKDAIDLYNKKGISENIPKDLKKNVTQMIVANTAKDMAKYLLNPSKENFSNMMEHTVKGIVEAVGITLATAFLGPIGGGATTQLFKMFWGAGEPVIVDPNKKLFDQIDKKLEMVLKDLKELDRKLDSLKVDLDEIMKSLELMNVVISEQNKIDTALKKFNDEITPIRNETRSIITIFQELKTQGAKTAIGVKDLKEYDTNLRKKISQILQLVWNSSSEISGINDWNIADEPDENSLVYLLVKNPVATFSKFDYVLNTLLPVFSQISYVIQFYAKQREYIFNAQCIYYVDVDYENKYSVSNNQEDLFINIGLEKKLHKTENTSFDFFLIELATKFGNATNIFGNNNINMYNSWKKYSYDFKLFDFRSAFCIEEYDAEKPDSIEKCTPIYYDYKESKFKKQFSKKYDRFLLLPNTSTVKSRNTHVLHCVNDDLNQALIPVNIGFDIKNLTNITLKGFGEFKNLRIVPTTESRTSENYTTNYVCDDKIINGGQLDGFWTSEKTIEIKDNTTVEFGLPISNLKLRIYYLYTSILRLRYQLFDTKTKEVVDIGDKFLESFGFYQSIKISSSHLDRLDLIQPAITDLNNKAFTALGIFDVKFYEKTTLDNRYLFTTFKDIDRKSDRLYPSQRLNKNGLKNSENHTLKFEADQSLALKSGVLNTHWYAGIEQNTFDKIKGVMAYFQNDGNLVIYNENAEIVWSTGLEITPPTKIKILNPYMILRENRNLTICENEETYWATDSYSLSGHEVRVGDFITNLSKIIFHKKRPSIKSFARFEFQIDGNLILYINDKERHSSNTVNNKACHAVFEPKGAISIYDADKKLLNTVREPSEKFGKGVILRIEAEFIHPDGYEYNSKFYLNVIDSQKNDAFWEFDEHTYIAKRGW